MLMGHLRARRDLTERHCHAIKEYQTAVQLMGHAYGLPGFKEAAERADKARIRYFEIREELHKHIEEHGC